MSLLNYEISTRSICLDDISEKFVLKLFKNRAIQHWFGTKNQQFREQEASFKNLTRTALIDSKLTSSSTMYLSISIKNAELPGTLTSTYAFFLSFLVGTLLQIGSENILLRKLYFKLGEQLPDP